MHKLARFTTEELEEEIRNRYLREENKPEPIPLDKIDWYGVFVLCKDRIDEIDNDKHNDDTIHYIYEAAMIAVFGNDVWDWINGGL